jgi:hypothetical protein
MTVGFECRSITLREAKAFIALHHRHNAPPQGWKYGFGCYVDGELVGVITVGRPVARNLDNGDVLEVTRCCTDGTPNAASYLYGKACKEAYRRGAKAVITYTHEGEPGSSLRACNWYPIYESDGGSWSKRSRPRTDKSSTKRKQAWLHAGPDSFNAAFLALKRRTPMEPEEVWHWNACGESCMTMYEEIDVDGLVIGLRCSNGCVMPPTLDCPSVPRLRIHPEWRSHIEAELDHLVDLWAEDESASQDPECRAGSGRDADDRDVPGPLADFSPTQAARSRRFHAGWQQTTRLPRARRAGP